MCKDCGPIWNTIRRFKRKPQFKMPRKKLPRSIYVSADKFKSDDCRHMPALRRDVKGAKFCPECGKPSSNPSSAKECGKPIEGKVKFCPDAERRSKQ